MKIGISLNEVFRDYLGQLTYTYEKYVGKTDIEEGDVTEFDLMKYFDSISTPMNFRPRLAQATPVVPLPMKGSRIVPFGCEARSQSHVIKRIGFGVG